MKFHQRSLKDACERCSQCGRELPDDSGVVPESRSPCSDCGSTARTFAIKLESRLDLKSSLRVRGKRGGKAKPFIDSRQGANFEVSSRTWNDLQRVIDRENDLYIERIVDPKSGQVLKEVREPLSQHRGHGSAKRRPPSG